MTSTCVVDRRDVPLRPVLQLLRAAQKPPTPGTPAWSRFVNRPLGRVLAAVAFKAGMSPTQVTALSAAFSFTAIAGLVLGPATPVTGILSASGLIIGYALDSADGQLARLTATSSPAGEWLDHVVDSAKVPAVHLAILVAWFRSGDVGSGWLAVPVVFALVASVHFFATILTDQLRRARPRPAEDAPPRRAGLVRAMAVVPTDYGLLCVAVAVSGWPALFAPAYLLLLVGTSGYVLLALPRWYRDVTRLSR